MRALFINIASHVGSLACVAEECVISSVSIDHRINDTELIGAFEELLRGAHWSFADLSQVACVTGPGGFMSLRVATAFTNTLMHQLKIPGAGIHLSDVYAARASGMQGNSFLWLHSTKKHELFVRGFGSFAERYPTAKWMELDTFLQALPEGTHWTGELIPEHEKAIGSRGVKVVSLRSLEVALPTFLVGLCYREEILQPWYGRGG